VALIAGVVLLLLAITLIASVGLGSQTGDNDPFDDDEAAEFLEDVNDNEGAWLGQYAVGMVTDAGLLVLAAGLLYVLFRDRSRVLALIGLTGITAGGAIAATTDVSGILTAILADDYVNGGGDLPAGDPASFQTARLAAMYTYTGFQAAGTAIGCGFIALGLLIAYAPTGAINPPRWLGWPAMIAGLAFLLSWIIVLTEAGFVFIIIGGLGILVFTIGLGAWLIVNRSLEPQGAAA
jgi:hypothetical protein